MADTTKEVDIDKVKSAGELRKLARLNTAEMSELRQTYQAIQNELAELRSPSTEDDPPEEEDIRSKEEEIRSKAGEVSEIQKKFSTLRKRSAKFVQRRNDLVKKENEAKRQEIENQIEEREHQLKIPALKETADRLRKECEQLAENAELASMRVQGPAAYTLKTRIRGLSRSALAAALSLKKAPSLKISEEERAHLAEE